jgi:hypothetical protein
MLFFVSYRGACAVAGSRTGVASRPSGFAGRLSARRAQGGCVLMCFLPQTPQRRLGYYLWNVMFPVFLLVLLSFGSFFFDLEAISERLNFIMARDIPLERWALPAPATATAWAPCSRPDTRRLTSSQPAAAQEAGRFVQTRVEIPYALRPPPWQLVILTLVAFKFAVAGSLCPPPASATSHTSVCAACFPAAPTNSVPLFTWLHYP